MNAVNNKSFNQDKPKVSRGFGSFQFTVKSLIGLAFIQLLIIGLAMHFTIEHYVTPTELSNAIAQKNSYLLKEHQQVVSLKEQTSAQLAVLAQRMGSLSARMNRIDALGERLAKTADYNEFDFSQMPAVGGPEQYSGINQSTELVALFSQMDSLLLHLDSQQDQLNLLETVMLNHEIHEDSLIAGRPINRGWLSSLYGMRNDPFNGKLTMHKGVDFAGTDGDDVMATGAGVVTWSGKRYGYGLLVEIDHGAGLKTRYAHAKALKVNVGDVVSKGEVIALMGNTGRSTGAHVHYEVLNKDKQVNPRKYIYR